MTIAREELAGMDFSDVGTGRRLKPVHPGTILEKEFIKPMNLTHYRVAKGLGIQQRRLDDICTGDRSVTADAALRLSRFFGMEAQFWMNLQSQYDLEVAEKELSKRLEKEVTPLKQAA